ncbi:LysR family transcriptional regulator [Streptomyces sp. 796.1]|uniref:LysR family transcriptional regulator n=1 Tax=Streptomyces sp. 796.1 TaxID=3163029 RepID=UPI0039C95082
MSAEAVRRPGPAPRAEAGPTDLTSDDTPAPAPGQALVGGPQAPGTADEPGRLDPPGPLSGLASLDSPSPPEGPAPRGSLNSLNALNAPSSLDSLGPLDPLGALGLPAVELRHLRGFVAVAEERNFTHAAHRLGVGQPALTRTVRGLEEAVGATLLERSTRRVALTDAGRRLYAELAVLLPRLGDALRAPCRHATLRLGFTSLLPVACAALHTAFESATGARIRLVRRDAPLAGLDTGDCDVAVLRGDAPPDTIRSRVVAHEARVAAVARSAAGAAGALARRRVLDWHELAGLPLVVNTVTGTTRPELWPAAHRPVLACTSGNFDEWLEAVAAGHGIGVAPESVAQRHTHPGIRFVRLKNAPPVAVRLAVPARGAHPLAAQYYALTSANWPAAAGHCATDR